MVDPKKPRPWQSAVTYLGRMSRRERLAVLAGLVFVAFFLVYEGIVDPFLSSKHKLERSLQAGADGILEMKLLQQHYQQISINKNDIIERLQQRRPDFNLFTFVEQHIDRLRMKERVVSIKPGWGESQGGIRQAVLELSIERVVLSQLVDFLAAIESFDMVVFVDRLVVQSDAAEDGLLDIKLDIVTLEIDPDS